MSIKPTLDWQDGPPSLAMLEEETILQSSVGLIGCSPPSLAMLEEEDHHGNQVWAWLEDGPPSLAMLEEEDYILQSSVGLIGGWSS